MGAKCKHSSRPSGAGNWAEGPTSSGCPSHHLLPQTAPPSWWPWPCPHHPRPPSSPSRRCCCSCSMGSPSPTRPSCLSSSAPWTHPRRSSCHCSGTWPWRARCSQRTPRSSGLWCHLRRCPHCCFGSCGPPGVFTERRRNSTEMAIPHWCPRLPRGRLLCGPSPVLCLDRGCRPAKHFLDMLVVDAPTRRELLLSLQSRGTWAGGGPLRMGAQIPPEWTQSPAARAHTLPVTRTGGYLPNSASGKGEKWLLP